MIRGIFLWGKLLKEFSPHPFQNFHRIFYVPHQRKYAQSAPFSHALRFGESVRAVQILLDFSLLYTDGAIAPASVLVPPPKTLRKVSLRWIFLRNRLMPTTLASPFGGGFSVTALWQLENAKRTTVEHKTQNVKLNFEKTTSPEAP